MAYRKKSIPVSDRVAENKGVSKYSFKNLPLRFKDGDHGQSRHPLKRLGLKVKKKG